MRKKLGIAFFLALLCSSEVFSQREETMIQIETQDDLGNVTDAFQESFFEALKQKAIENHEKAIQALVECLALDPSQSVVYLELGKNYNALEEFDEAASYLKKAREAEPQNEAVLTELYQTYYLSEQFDQALPVVEELTTMNSGFSEDLANLYMINERYDEALELLDDLDEEWGSSTYRNGLRHEIYSRTNDTGAYIQDLKNRIKDNPEDEQNFLNLIFAYSEEGNPEKAFETAKELQEMHPASDLVHLALYKFYLVEGDPEESLKSMEIILESEEIDEKTKYDVLNDFMLFTAENPSLEQELMRMVKVFSENEGNTMIYGQLGTFFLGKGEKEQALNYFERAVSGELDDFMLLRNTLLLQLDLGKYEEAKRLSEKAVENFPSQSVLYLLNGTALNALESFAEAEEILNFGLDFLIDNPEMEAEFYRQLAVTHTGLNNEAKAAEFQEKLEEIKKENIDE